MGRTPSRRLPLINPFGRKVTRRTGFRARRPRFERRRPRKDIIGLLLMLSLPGYLFLQLRMAWRYRGGWLIAALVPLGAMVPLLVYQPGVAFFRRRQPLAAPADPSRGSAFAFGYLVIDRRRRDCSGWDRCREPLPASVRAERGDGRTPYDGGATSFSASVCRQGACH